MTSVHENVVGLHHPWTLSPKVIWILSSSYCGLQVVDDDDDVPDRNIRMWWWWCCWSKEQSMMMMTIADRKIRVWWWWCCWLKVQSMMIIMMMIKSLDYDDDDADRKFRWWCCWLKWSSNKSVAAIEVWRGRLYVEYCEKIPMIYRCITLMMLMIPSLSYSCCCCCYRIPFSLRGSVEIL